MDHVNKLIEQTLSQKPYLREEITRGLFGLERENLRVTPEGQIASTMHPQSLGNKYTHPFFTTDFGEAQPELITPPLTSIAEMLGFMETLHDIMSAHIGNEYIWPHSLPPVHRTTPVTVAHFGTDGKEKSEYRNYLLNRYGENRMLMCGIHFNFSFSETLLKELGGEEQKNAIYLKVLRNFIRYRWMLIWLYGCSPYISEGPAKQVDGSEGNECGCKGEQSTSLRNSRAGYKNEKDLFFRYESMEEYLTTLQTHIDSQTLYSEAELYTPIRIKRNSTGRITHLELRIFDLFPYNKVNVSSEALHFTHLFLLFCLFEPEDTPHLSCQEHHISNRNSDHASCCGAFNFELKHFDGTSAEVKEQLNAMFEKVSALADQFNFASINSMYKQALEEAKQWIETPEKRALIRLRKDIQEEGFMNFCMRKAKEYKVESYNSRYCFHGLEDLELSTQLLLQAALLKGIHFEILDRSENFIQLYTSSHSENVVQATKTSLDNYSSILVMENKVVTKKILSQHGIKVPRGKDYHKVNEARSDYELHKNNPIVIKPKSTNFGLGITIFKEASFSKEMYSQAIDIAFEHDSCVLVEEFISGKEYRFFVLNNEVVGILHRVPANVCGDGTSSITELVEQKNQNPLRGKGYKTPLEKIQLGEAEQMFLATQGLKFTSVPSAGTTVYLRENSNISTGGDSIDFTDNMHPSYIEIALDAAKAAKVMITGLDMMIDDINQPANENNCAVIEMNFNPAIHIHCYPFQGENRHLNEKLIDLLFPENLNL